MSAGLVVAVVMALAFAATNGLHDAANSIATLVMTRAARPGRRWSSPPPGNVIGPLAHRAGGGGHDRGDRHGAGRRSRRGARRRAHRRGRVERDHVVAGPAVELRARAARWSRRRRAGRGRNVGRQLGRLRRVATRRRARESWPCSPIAPVVGLAAGFVADRVARWLHRTRATTASVARCAAGSGRCRAASRSATAPTMRRRSSASSRSCCSRAARRRSLQAPTWVELACGTALTVGTAFGGWPIVRTIGRAHRAAAPDRRARQPDRLDGGAARRDADGRAGEHHASGRVVGRGCRRRQAADPARPLGRRAFHADRLAADGSRDRALAIVALFPWRWLA